MSEFINQSDICASTILLSENRTGDNSSIVNEARVLRMWPIGAAANVMQEGQQQVLQHVYVLYLDKQLCFCGKKLLKSLQQSFLISN